MQINESNYPTILAAFNLIQLHDHEMVTDEATLPDAFTETVLADMESTLKSMTHLQFVKICSGNNCQIEYVIEQIPNGRRLDQFLETLVAVKDGTFFPVTIFHSCKQEDTNDGKHMDREKRRMRHLSQVL